jgi:hypothetical protein
MAVVLRYPKVWLVCLVTLGYLLLPGYLPPRFKVEHDWDSGPNWFGQPTWTAFVYADGLLISLCVLRFLIVRGNRRASDATAWYCLALAVYLPAIWLLVVVDWDNDAVAPIACWVGVPIALLFVPSVVFCADLLLRPALSPARYALRSALEIVVLVPLWSFLWGFVEFLILGWFGP